MIPLPTLDDLTRAAGLVHRHLGPTPQRRWPRLCDALGTDVVARVLAGGAS